METRTASPRQQLNEWRRLRAWSLAQEGWTGSAIAQALGVTPGAVSQWLKRAREHGPAALHHRMPPGPAYKLTAEQRAQLPTLLAHGAEAYGFLGDFWTTKRVAAVIQRELGVRYHPAHVSRLLRQIGWSVQQPVQRATQRDEAAIARWHSERWPVLQAKPKASGGRSSGSTNPASICSPPSSAPMPRAVRRPFSEPR
jgi:transposase